MKKFYRSVSSFTTWLSAIGLSLFGYNYDENRDDRDAPMYGTPTGSYENKLSLHK